MTTQYDIGDLPAVTATFVPDTINPSAVVSAVTVKTEAPDATVVTYTDASPEVAEVSDNVWRFTFPAALDQAGFWAVKFWGTAGLVTAEETTLFVKTPKVT